MSWKGFVKGATRLPHTIASKTGYAQTTKHGEFEELHESFKLMESLTIKLHEDAIIFKDALKSMLTHQTSFAETLTEVFRPITARRNSDVDLEQLQISDSSSPLGPEAKRVADFAAAFADLRDQLLPDLDIIERRVIAPTNDLLAMMANIRKVITKRAHKLIDYDRHRDSVKKLKDRTDRTHGDEKKLGQLEAALDQATRDYQNINNTLMREIPILLSLRISFADPCFRTLFWYQLKVFQALQVTFSKLTRSTFKTPLSAKDGYLLKEIELLQMLSELSLVKRPFKSSDGTEIRGAFYDENDNNLTLSSSNEKYPPSSAASPPSYGQLSPTSPSSASRHQQQLNQAEHFPDMHKQFSPSPIGSTGILSSHASPAADGSVRRQFCVALYDFTGETNDDLSFYRDDRIEIVKKTESANDWWTGKLRGKVGSFPGNYVTALED